MKIVLTEQEIRVAISNYVDEKLDRDNTYASDVCLEPVDKEEMMPVDGIEAIVNIDDEEIK